MFGGGLVGYSSLISGISSVGAFSIGVLSLLLIRWIWATMGRTRYWLPRGTQGVYYQSCPNCNERRYRVSGDWILKCHACGWTVGWPVVRWITRSEPAVQFRRSVSRVEAVIFGVFALGLSIWSLLNIRSSKLGLSLLFLDLDWLPSLTEVAVWFGSATLICVLVIWMLFYRRVYCANCGQYLGRGEPPSVCPKCDSNRFTHQDPGVGEKRQIQIMDK